MKKPKDIHQIPSLDTIKSLLNYDPETGYFTRKYSFQRHRYEGKIAGSKTQKGYITIHINGWQYYAHRLAWLYMTGEWPENIIDHINLLKDDNRWCNLREATIAQNSRNRGKNKSNTTGYKGIHKNRQGYMVRICIGTYKTLEEAAKVYAEACELYHGKFARLE